MSAYLALAVVASAALLLAGMPWLVLVGLWIVMGLLGALVWALGRDGSDLDDTQDWCDAAHVADDHCCACEAGTDARCPRCGRDMMRRGYR